MDCLFCGKEMRTGGIPAFKYGIRWISRDHSNGMEAEEVPLAKPALLWPEDAEAFYCPSCRQVVVPVPKIEPVTRKWKKKLERVLSQADQARKERETRQNEKKEEKKWDKRREKDPWEW